MEKSKLSGYSSGARTSRSTHVSSTWRPPFFVPPRDGFTGIVELLLRRGANVNLTLDDGTSPLTAAARKGNTDVCRLLLREPDIQVNQPSASGVTALALACEAGYKEIVKLLLRKGADANLSTESGISPLHVASLHGHTAVVGLLLNTGADTDATVVVTDESTYTAYQIAWLVGNREIAALLAARRRARAEQPAGFERLPPCLRPQGQALEDKADPSTSPTAPTQSSPPDTIGLSTRPGEAAATAISPVDPGSQPTPEKTPGPLETAKQALRQEVLGKLRNNNLESLEGIRLLLDVNTTADIDGLCSLYNRLAHIERQKERARRRQPVRGRGLAAGTEAAPVGAASPRFALGGQTEPGCRCRRERDQEASGRSASPVCQPGSERHGVRPGQTDFRLSGFAACLGRDSRGEELQCVLLQGRRAATDKDSGDRIPPGCGDLSAGLHGQGIERGWEHTAPFLT